MANDTYNSPPRSDAEVLHSILAVPSALGVPPDQITLTIRVLAGGEETIQGSKLETNKLLQAVKGSSNSVVKFTKAAWSRPEGTVSVQVERRSEGDLQVRRDHPDNIPPVDSLRFGEAVLTSFPGWRSLESAKKILGVELTEFFQSRELALARLEKLVDRSVETTEELRRKLTEESITARAEYKKTVDAETDRIRTDIETREAALQVALRELQNEREALDDRSAQHARRDARKTLSADVKSALTKFTVTDGTEHKRRPVAYTLRLLMTLTAVSFAYSLWQAVNLTGGESALRWYVLIKVPASLIGFAVAASYYVKWENAWFQQHASEEFRLKRFDLDIQRASWLMELLFEWQEKKDHPIPQPLVERLTYGLFHSEEGAGRLTNPDDTLAAFVRGSSNVKLPLPNGGELTLTGSNFKKVEKEIEGKS